jgi:hypothetical protein
MKVVSFAVYYVKLQTAVQLGLYDTAYPLSIRWQWRFWNRRYLNGRRNIL